MVFLQLLLGCAALACAEQGDADARNPDDAGEAQTPQEKRRTVTIDIIKTGERMLSRAPDGSVVYGPPVEFGGVEVCVAQRRPAAAIFEPFEELDPPICETSVAGQNVRLSGVPASSDLIITLTKDGYLPGSMTFRTDEFDVGVPTDWGPGAIRPLTAEGALEMTWIELEPAPRAGNSVVTIFAYAVWFGAGFPPTVMDFWAEPPLPVVTTAEGVSVTIERAGRSIAELSTSRERPSYVSLPPGLYALRFSHPTMGAIPVGAREQYYIHGLGTDRTDTIELPVIAGHDTLGSAVMGCGAPVLGQLVEDLATCRLAPVDAGAP